MIRHGETDWNRDERIQGTSDVPLNAAGVAQARALRARLAPRVFDAVYASDLQRARATAETALPGAEVRLDPRLRELAYGVLEGHRWEQLDDEQAAQVRHWREDPFERRVEGGESYGDLTARVQEFLDELPDEGSFAVFSHGGAIVSALYGIIGRPADGSWRIVLANTSITRLRYDARGVTLHSLNDHAHLDDGLD